MNVGTIAVHRSIRLLSTAGSESRHSVSFSTLAGRGNSQNMPCQNRTFHIIHSTVHTNTLQALLKFLNSRSKAAKLEVPLMRAASSSMTAKSMRRKAFA